MPESHDDAATIDLTAAAIDEAWLIREIEPTNLIFTWPDKEAPEAEHVLASLTEQASGGARLVETIDPESPEVAWAIVVQVGSRRMPILIWAEPGRPISPEDAAAIGVNQPEWLVGIETILNQDEPLEDYSQIVHWLSCATPGAAMLDVNTQQWFPHASLEALFGDEGVEPRAETLWTIHVVSDEKRTSCWLHTHGLHRCGRAELEMLNVPGDLAVAGCELINTVAEALIDRPAPPPPGEQWPIGVEFDITLTPWADAVTHIPEGVHGSLADRSGELMEAHQGVRGVIAPAGEELTEHMLQRFLEGENLIFRSHRATERRAKMARARWTDLIDAHSCAREHADMACLAKVGVVFGEEPEDREHLWYEIDGFADQQANGTLSSAPMLIPDLKPGDVRSFHPAEVSDWIVCTHDRRFGPNDVAQLRVFLANARNNSR